MKKISLLPLLALLVFGNAFALNHKYKSSGLGALSDNTNGRATTDQGIGTYTWGTYSSSTRVPLLTADSLNLVRDSSTSVGGQAPGLIVNDYMIPVGTGIPDSARACFNLLAKDSASVTVKLFTSIDAGATFQLPILPGITPTAFSKSITLNTTARTTVCVAFPFIPGALSKLNLILATPSTDSIWFYWGKLSTFRK